MKFIKPNKRGPKRIPEKKIESLKPGAVELMLGLQNGSINPKSVTLIQRRECVAIMRYEGTPVRVIADLFKVVPQLIYQDQWWIAQQWGEVAKKWDFDKALGDWLAWNEKIRSAAMKTGDLNLTKKITDDVFDTLVRFGIAKAPPDSAPVEDNSIEAIFLKIARRASNTSSRITRQPSIPGRLVEAIQLKSVDGKTFT